MRTLVAVFLPIFFIGCASESELQMGYDAQMRAVDIQASIMKEQQPTFSIDCTEGCGNAKINYLDPRDRHKLTLPRVTNTNDTIIHSLKPAVTALGYVAGAVTAIRVADDIFNATGSGNNEVHSTNITNGDNNTNDMASTTTRSHADGNTSSSTADNNQDNDVAYTDSQNDNSVNNQDDNSVVNNDDNSTVTNDSHDQTATPTIVEQPTPIIVTETDTLVVDPVILNADGTCTGLGCD